MAGIPNNNAARAVIEQLHQCIGRIAGSNPRKVYERTLRDNRLFRTVCAEPSLDPGEYARTMVSKYDYDMGGGLVVVRLRAFRLYGYGPCRDDNLKQLCAWAGEVGDQFAQCVQTFKHADFERLKEVRENVPEAFIANGEPMRFLSRFVSLMLYTRHPELNVYGDAEKLETFGDVWAKYFFDEALDILDSFCQDEGLDPAAESDAVKLAYEQEKRKVAQLSAALERANTAMQDLETEFEERLEEEKTASLTEFFSRLNSERYGCILDELFNVHKGLGELQKKNIKVPLELSGLRIVVIKLAQFVRDSHIDPIIPEVNSIRTVRADEVIGCDYDGTPFWDKDEKKTVRVISSGWKYVDKEIKIARPKLKEVTDNEVQR